MCIRDRCKKIEKESWILPRGIDFDVIDRVGERVGSSKNDKFTLFFGGRLNSLKRAEQLMWTYDNFFAAGRDVRIVLTSPIIGSYKKNIPPEIEIKVGMKTEEFLEECYKAHVLLASSRIEGFTVGLLEQMYTGIVTILPDLEWAKVLMKDRWKDYPFKYRSFSEAYGWIRWVYQHYEEAKKKVEWVPGWLKEQYSEEACKLKMHDMVFDYVKSNFWPPELLGRRKTNRNRELVHQYVARMPEVFGMEDLMKAIAKGKDNSYKIQDFVNTLRGKMNAWDMYSYLSFSDLVEDTGEREVKFRRLK